MPRKGKEERAPLEGIIIVALVVILCWFFWGVWQAFKFVALVVILGWLLWQAWQAFK